MSATPLDGAFWKGKRVLVTGHSGFKGGWLALWLARLGAKVAGVSLPPNTSPSLFELARLSSACESHFVDIRDVAGLAARIRDARPDIVFHLAAQPLVRASFRDPIETFSTNVMGTAHVLEAIRPLASVRAAVMITTDKVYRNHESMRPYHEDDPLGGHDPYGASKAACEIVIDSYRKSFLAERGVAVASARAGNVIGGGDWSEDRLLPDAVRAWQRGDCLEVRRPAAVRPWQHVIEPLAGYLVLAQRLWADHGLADAYNFGPPPRDAATVKDVVELARASWTSGSADVKYGDGGDGPHEAGLLVLENAKARNALGVAPRLSLKEAVRRTMAWYQAQSGGTDARALCEDDIASYEAAMGA